MAKNGPYVKPAVMEENKLYFKPSSVPSWDNFNRNNIVAFGKYYRLPQQ